MVAHVCNHRTWWVEIGGSWFEVSLGKDPISKNKADIRFHACNLSYLGGRGRRTVVQSWPGKKYKTLSEKLLM
jgi:hypothetical protein